APSVAVTKVASPTSVSEGGVGSQSGNYTYTVKNTSAATTDSELSVVVSDTDGTPTYVSGDTDSDGKVDFGETWTYSLTTTAPNQNAGTSHTNTFSATGTDDDSSTGSATSQPTRPSSDLAPSVAVTKTASPTS